MAKKKPRGTGSGGKPVTKASATRKLRSLERQSAKLLEAGPLDDRGRERLAAAFMSVLEDARALEDRELFVQAAAAVGPHMASALFSLGDESDWWDTWWAKSRWLAQEYGRCRRRYRTKRQRAACFARRSAEATMCAGSNGAQKASAWIPMDVLAEAGLETRGLPHAFGLVPFFSSDDTLSLGELNKLVDVRYWSSVRKARLQGRAAITRSTAAPGVPPEKLLAQVGERRLGRSKISAALNQDLLRETIAADEAEVARRGAAAFDTMRRVALVQWEGASYLVSVLNPDEPELIAEVPPTGNVIDASEGDALDEALFWVELMLETGMGLLTLLGVRFPGAQRKLGGWVRRLLRRINANRRLRRMLLTWIRNVGRVGFSAGALWDLMCILWDAIDMEFVSDFIEDMADIGHWTILLILAKLGARITPGAGQALLAADLALLAVELGAKIYRRTEQPRTQA